MKNGVDHIGACLLFFCHDGQGNFVVAKRGQNCRDECVVWDIGGGALELGDSVETSLQKEIAEEYCTDVLAYEFLGSRDVHREHEVVKTHWIALDFKVLVDRAKVKNGEPHKFDALEWYTLNNFPKETHSEFTKFLSMYTAKLGHRIRNLPGIKKSSAAGGFFV